MVLFANCETGEFAVSGQHIFTSAELEALQSFSIGLPDNLMSWLIVVENEGTELAPASVGVICTDESGAVDDGVDLDISTKTSINNVVNQFIRVAGGQIINLGQIINIYQNITQVAYQYVNITGKNNTVNQIINQSASQIVAANGTNIGQIINQTAVQAGIITPEQAGNTTTPTVQRQIGPGAAPDGPTVSDDCDGEVARAGEADGLGLPYKVEEGCIDYYNQLRSTYNLPPLDSEGNIIDTTLPPGSSTAIGPNSGNTAPLETDDDGASETTPPETEGRPSDEDGSGNEIEVTTLPTPPETTTEEETTEEEEEEEETASAATTTPTDDDGADNPDNTAAD